MNEKIMLDATRKQERMRQAQADAEEKQRAEKLSTLADGELEMRELVLEEPISARGHDGQYTKWTLFAGRREPLWTSYTAEPAKLDSSFVTATMPTVTVQVIDFSKSHYHGTHGRKRIDTLINEINRLKDVQSPHVAQVYAVQRGKSPKGWERLIIVVERVAEGGKLKTWLPSDGFGEETAKVSLHDLTATHAQDYITQILSALVDMHRVHVYQKRELEACSSKADRQNSTRISSSCRLVTREKSASSSPEPATRDASSSTTAPTRSFTSFRRKATQTHGG